MNLFKVYLDFWIATTYGQTSTFNFVRSIFSVSINYFSDRHRCRVPKMLKTLRPQERIFGRRAHRRHCYRNKNSSWKIASRYSHGKTQLRWGLLIPTHAEGATLVADILIWVLQFTFGINMNSFSQVRLVQFRSGYLSYMLPLLSL